jgi:hypothetical protein
LHPPQGTRPAASEETGKINTLANPTINPKKRSLDIILLYDKSKKKTK